MTAILSKKEILLKIADMFMSSDSPSYSANVLLAQCCGSKAENLCHFDRAWGDTFRHSVRTLWPHRGGDRLYSLCESLICCQQPINSKNHSYQLKTKWDAWCLSNLGIRECPDSDELVHEGQLPWTELEVTALSKSVRSLYGFVT